MNLHLPTIFRNNAVISIRIIVAFLSLTYGSVFLFSPAVLPHHEHDHVQHGLDTCQKDPCHISIYHHGYAGGCNHKYHFTQAPDKCPWCDVILAYQVAPISTEFLFDEINFSTVLCKVEQATDLLIPFCHSGRGPPVSVLI